MDWEAVFAGYRSQVDWPGARYWRELADAFPEARVILTVRPPEDWYRSFAATVAPELLGPPASDDPVAAARRRMQRETIAEQVFGGRPLDRDHAIAVFRDHVAQVSRTVAPRRLLVFDRWALVRLPRRGGAPHAVSGDEHRPRVPRGHVDPAPGPLAAPPGLQTRTRFPE